MVKFAFEFLVLTAARSGEVQLATWDEIDTSGAVDDPDDARERQASTGSRYAGARCRSSAPRGRSATMGPPPLIFPDVRANRLSDTMFSKLRKVLEIGAVRHGFRSSFRDWAAEETNHSPEVLEAAHVIQNDADPAYVRSDLFERRRG